MSKVSLVTIRINSTTQLINTLKHIEQMVTKVIFKSKGMHTKVARAAEFGKKLFSNCKSDFTLYIEYERLLYTLLDKELYSEFIGIMANILPQSMNQFKDFSDFIVQQTENYGST